MELSRELVDIKITNGALRINTYTVSLYPEEYLTLVEEIEKNFNIPELKKAKAAKLKTSGEKGIKDAS